MQAKDFNGLYAIIPTPSRAGAQAIDATDTVALDETERLVRALIDDGANGLIVLGTTGECATISNEDYRSFVATVADTVGKRIPLFVGATAMGGHEAYKRLAFARDQGADGTLLGLPMWQPCTVDMAVRFYAEVGQAFPDLAVMVYANARAFRFSFPTDFWARIAKEAPTVTSAKSSQPTNLAENIAATGGRIHFMPSDMVAAKFQAISPATTRSCWATAAGMGPEPARALIDAILAGDAERTAYLDERIAWSNAPLAPMLGNPELFASYNTQMEKTRMAQAGYCDPGPIRPPYDVFPADYVEASREAGRRWCQLRDELSGDHAAAPAEAVS
ncbi:dihydrodipicolinate synthase family protein [Parablastomonas sp. CN1-191]|uniref:dihydrodipicolinate synthase family protein n=1 Tax=Parablastomonas sp. CN1-191 TaxID=3400908 RepID=UPI003BF83696